MNIQILFDTICAHPFYVHINELVLANPQTNFTDIYKLLFSIDENHRMFYKVFESALMNYINQVKTTVTPEVYVNLIEYLLVD